MRNYYLGFLIFFSFSYLFAGGGINATYMSFRLDGGPQFYHGTGPNGYPTLHGAVLATNLDLNANRLDLQLRGLTTWYDSGCFMTSASIHYRVYKNTDPAPSFTTLNLTNQIGIGFNNIDWSDNSPLIHLLAGLTSAGTYNFEVYFSVTTNNIGGCQPEIIENNGGSNFIGTFTVLTPLPVKFKDFSVKRKDESNELTWTTASETNNDYFEVQHSTDGRQFEAVGQVKGYGNSNTDRDYYFSHEVSGSTRSYYRLKQVDFDGKYEYSGIISVGSENDRLDERIAVSPNPVSDFLIVSGITEQADYLITDYSGRQIMTGSVASGQSLDVATLAPGFYTLIVQEGAQRTAHKWIKQ
jgi:hypothetical protein